MKKVVYICTLLTILTSPLFAQEQDSVIIPKNNMGFAEYSEVIPVDSTSKNDLYIRALEWVNKTYKSGKSVIQTTDKDGGMIIGKAITHTLIYNNVGIKMDGGYFSYTISIYCKDNKYKYVIDNITYNKGIVELNSGADLAESFPSNWKGIQGSKYNRKQWKSFQSQANTELNLIIEDLKKHMKKKSEW